MYNSMTNSDADILGFEKVGATPQSTQTKKSETPEQKVTRTAVEVALLYKGKEIYLRNLTLNNDGLLVGKVSGLSNICAREFEGIKLGQTLSFRYQHIQHSTGHNA